MTFRLFLAIPIPVNIKRQFLDVIDLPEFYKITKPENIHITLFFFGDIEGDRIKVIKESLDPILVDRNSFRLGINSIGQFPEKGLPRIVYLSGDIGKNDLQSLAKDICDTLLGIGFAEDKSFKYHITVARLNERADMDRRFRVPEFGASLSFDVEKIILYRSDLQKSGPLYTSIHEWILK